MKKTISLVALFLSFIFCNTQNMAAAEQQILPSTVVLCSVTKHDIGIASSAVYLKLGGKEKFKIRGVCSRNKQLYAIMTEKQFEELTKLTSRYYRPDHRPDFLPSDELIPCIKP